MSLLLDTHTLAWWASDSSDLSAVARDAIQSSPVVLVSAISVYEAAYKNRRGRWPEAALLLRDLPGFLLAQRFEGLAVSLDHAHRAGFLAAIHRDPFDRILVAQALADDLTLVSADEQLDRFGVRRLW